MTVHFRRDKLFKERFVIRTTETGLFRVQRMDVLNNEELLTNLGLESKEGRGL